ncbi:MAG: hypothetical protein K6B74_01780 [Ruminococcus sp.]|nr:hypothetical protein [Ruminococcus sp.]
MIIMYFSFHDHGSYAPPALRKRTERFSDDEADRIWRTFITAYLDTEDKEFIEKAERQILIVSLLEALFSGEAMSGSVSANEMSEIKQKLFELYDKGFDPVCF